MEQFYSNDPLVIPFIVKLFCRETQNHDEIIY